MMLDEMREACELGFSPHVHLITAWPVEKILGLVKDRLFCRCTGGHVPFTFETYSPKIRNVLSIKHRVYMSKHLEEYDIFLQVEDDMILTLNHLLMFMEQSAEISNQQKDTQARHTLRQRHKIHYVPGFIRVEPMPQGNIDNSWVGPGAGKTMSAKEMYNRLKNRQKVAHDKAEAGGLISGGGGGGGEGEGEGPKNLGSASAWFEWEIILSRPQRLDSGRRKHLTLFFPIRIGDAGVYVTLGSSRVLQRGGNNQGLWVATQDQLRLLARNCNYLDFTNETRTGNVETHSGSFQMFSPGCRFAKVFPAASFFDFLVHHRTNNKNGIRGESIPAVPISDLQIWVAQFLRDGPNIPDVLISAVTLSRPYG
ncbi:unnamed protein product [Discosporangium mesarthrocarpum]